jgi:hypothetical protein
MKYRPLLLLLFFAFALLVFRETNAQTTSTVRADVNSTTQNIAAALASLPEADTLIYINPRRILNDALPRVLPASDLAELRKGLEDVKKDAGVDLSNLDYVVVAMRFRKPGRRSQFHTTRGDGCCEWRPKCRFANDNGAARITGESTRRNPWRQEDCHHENRSDR